MVGWPLLSKVEKVVAKNTFSILSEEAAMIRNNAAQDAVVDFGRPARTSGSDSSDDS